MLSLFISLFLLCGNATEYFSTSFSNHFSDKIGGESPHLRITGGDYAALGKIPYQVSIQLNNEHKCVGTIINSRWILTTAQGFVTFKNTPSKYTVLAGTISLDEKSTVLGVKNYTIHENYNTDYPMVNDIALVELNSELTWSNNIRPVIIPSVYRSLADIDVIASGWGYTTNSTSSIRSTTLKKVTLRTITNRACNAYYNRPCGLHAYHTHVPDNSICASSKHPGEGLYEGDFGGPVVHAVTKELVGIASRNVACGGGSPEIFNRVDDNILWIQHIIHPQTTVTNIECKTTGKTGQTF